jgi:hypothetical protein
MELQQPKYIRKVKLKLIQPAIKCSGRNNVTCTYRGRVTEDSYNWMYIQIKVYGEWQTILWSKEDNKCLTEGFEDLKLIE